MLSNYIQKLQKSGKMYFKIRVRPGADKTMVKEIMSNDIIKIDLAALPIKGKANQELVNLLAHQFEVSKNNVTIISGAHKRIKLVKIVK